MRTLYRILVVDDDPSILELTTSVLLDEGYEVIPAAGGAQALKIATTQRLDCILLDMRMPDVSGWDVARELKAHGFRIPIIVITASPDAARSAREIGADGFVEKPFTITDLIDAVEKLCHSPRPALAVPARLPPLHA